MHNVHNSRGTDVRQVRETKSGFQGDVPESLASAPTEDGGDGVVVGRGGGGENEQGRKYDNGRTQCDTSLPPLACHFSFIVLFFFSYEEENDE